MGFWSACRPRRGKLVAELRLPKRDPGAQQLDGAIETEKDRVDFRCRGL
jgi:hypothetical protein